MLSEHESGVTVEVWVVPGSSRDVVGGSHGGALRVRTSAPPEHGKANEAVVRLIAARFGATRARLVSGASSRRKQILVEGITLADARRALAASDD
jgi:uncharacterized protein